MFTLENIWGLYEILSKLRCAILIKSTMAKVKKSIVLIQNIRIRIRIRIPILSLITIAKPYLDFGDLNFDHVFNDFFHQNMETVEYGAALVISQTIKGTPKEKLYQEFGFERMVQYTITFLQNSKK